VTESSRITRCALYRDGAVLRLVGDIDIGNWVGVGSQVAAEVGAGVVTLDLTEVHYFGAAGVRVVLTGHAARPSGATLEVRCAPAVFRVMRISGLVGADGLVVTEYDRQYSAQYGRPGGAGR
jgi:anti-anti-sigma factor